MFYNIVAVVPRRLVIILIIILPRPTGRRPTTVAPPCWIHHHKPPHAEPGRLFSLNNNRWAINVSVRVSGVILLTFVSPTKSIRVFIKNVLIF